MPKLGLTMTEGTITEWVAEAGATVTKGSVVMTIETDKVEEEVSAEGDGIVFHTAAAGETLEPGEIVGWLLADGETPPDGSAAPAPVEEAAPAPVEEAAPAPVEEAAPAPVEEAAPAPVEETSEAAATEPQTETTEQEATEGRVLSSPNARRIAAEQGIDLASVKGTGPGGRITTEDLSNAPETPAPQTGRILSSPNARRVAAEQGIDLASVKGTGPGGRITSEDVLATPAPVPQTAPVEPEETTPPATAESQAEEPVAQLPAPDKPQDSLVPFAARMAAERLGVNIDEVQGSGPDGRVSRTDVYNHARSKDLKTKSFITAQSTGVPGERIPLKGMRGIIAERMYSSLQEMAQLTLTMDVDMDRVIALRDQLKDIGSEEAEIVPGYTDFVIAAVAQALRQHPEANSQIDGSDVVLLEQINVGMAVAVPDGLLVPVVQETDKLGLKEIAEETSRLATAAREKKLSLAEMEGGTFSVTALGMFGVDAFTPVINPPNSGILGVGRIRDDVAWEGDVPIRVKRMTISLTWDHRVLDGAPAAEFAATIKKLLEQPLRLLG